MRRLNDIAVPGVAEEMLEASGFSVLERGGCVSTMEWPDAELGVAGDLECRTGRARAAEHGRNGAAPGRARRPRAVPRQRGVYRTRSDHQFVIASKP